jgi:hypothetical protein
MGIRNRVISQPHGDAGPPPHSALNRIRQLNIQDLHPLRESRSGQLPKPGESTEVPGTALGEPPSGNRKW